MLVPRQEYSRELKIAAMREMEEKSKHLAVTMIFSERQQPP
jgi:hypothetical protein